MVSGILPIILPGRPARIRTLARNLPFQFAPPGHHITGNKLPCLSISQLLPVDFAASGSIPEQKETS
jgi:hypothetical protein